MACQSSDFRLSLACEVDCWTISVFGELDLFRGVDLVEVVQVLKECRVVVLVIDLGQVTFADTAGYRSRGRAVCIIESGGGSVRVVNLSPAVVRWTRTLQLAG
jgi:anti-anti-sigma factor